VVNAKQRVTNLHQHLHVVWVDLFLMQTSSEARRVHLDDGQDDGTRGRKGSKCFKLVSMLKRWLNKTDLN
jgi:hypothetical protein